MRTKDSCQGAGTARGLPAPEELLQQLLGGAAARVQDHTLAYDAAAGVVWATNPYGIDCMFCSGEPDLDRCRAFLSLLSQGGMLGPEP